MVGTHNYGCIQPYRYGCNGLTLAVSHIQVKFSISTTSTGMELSVQ